MQIQAHQQTNKKYLVEFEGYSDKYNNFIFKEIAFYDLQTKKIYNYFLDTKLINYYKKLDKLKTNIWLVNNFHLIPFEFGCYKFKYINEKYFNTKDILCEFYVKDLLKQNTIKKYTNFQVYNLQTIFPNIPNLKNLPKVNQNFLFCCFDKHIDNFAHCALNKLLKLSNFIFNKNAN